MTTASIGRASRICADVPVSLRSDDFTDLRKVLRSIRNPAAGNQSWWPMEGGLELTFQTGGQVVEARGVASERPDDYGNKLQFSMPLSLVSIDRAIDDIDELPCP